MRAVSGRGAGRRARHGSIEGRGHRLLQEDRRV
jgi:hypothetical protein